MSTPTAYQSRGPQVGPDVSSTPLHQVQHLQALAGALHGLKDGLAQQAAIGQFSIGGTSHLDNSDIVVIRQELRDKQARLAQLKGDFDKLKAHLEAERLVQKRALEQCEEYKTMLREKDRKLLESQQQMERMRLQQDANRLAQAQIDDLRATNSQLEQHVQSMIASAKYLDSDEQSRLQKVVAEYQQNVATMNQTLQERDNKIDQLQGQVVALNARLNYTTGTTAAAAASAAASSDDLATLKQENQALQAKLKLYASDTGVDPQDMMRALDLVRRDREAAGGRFVGAKDADDLDSTALKRRLQESELRNRDLTRDLQHQGDLLRVQKRLNDQQSIEINRLRDESTRLRGEVAVLKQVSQQPTIKPPSDSATLRHHGVVLRDAEPAKGVSPSSPHAAVHPLTAHVRAQGNRPNHGHHGAVPSITSESMFSMAGDMDDPNWSRDFAPTGRGEVVAFYVSQVALHTECTALQHPSDPSVEPITFITVDFFTFDTTSSTLLGGWSPNFEFLSQFKVNLDDHFLDYMAADGVAIELWVQRRELSAERVASAKLPLAPLLSRTDGRLSGSVALFVHENEADDRRRTDTVVSQAGVLHFKLALLRYASRYASNTHTPTCRCSFYARGLSVSPCLY